MVVEQKVRELQHFINGTLVPGTSGRFSNVYNPCTGEVIARVPLATKEEVKDAIDTSKRAFPAWKKQSAGKRAEIVQRFRQLIAENIDELIEIICEESGKTKEDAKGEITRGLESVDFSN